MARLPQGPLLLGLASRMQAASGKSSAASLAKSLVVERRETAGLELFRHRAQQTPCQQTDPCEGAGLARCGWRFWSLRTSHCGSVCPDRCRKRRRPDSLKLATWPLVGPVVCARRTVSDEVQVVGGEVPDCPREIVPAADLQPTTSIIR